MQGYRQEAKFLVKYVILIVSTLSAFGCKTTEKSLPSTIKGFVVDDGLRWPKGRAEICWKTPGFAKEKQIIKTALETEYNEKTSFEFFGFYDCGANLQNKLIVEFEPEIHPDATTGFGDKNIVRMFASPFSTLFPSCKKSPEMAEVCLNNVSLHEFGHAAGLVHEQDRSDSNCDEHKGNPDSTTRAIGNYDNESIMNACNPRYYAEKLSLSAGDIVAVNTLYPDSYTAKSSEKTQRVDACQRCGQDKPDNRYCGIVDPKTGVWQSGSWAACSTDKEVINKCQPCGKDRPNERFCGIYGANSWNGGSWILCTGEAPAVPTTENNENTKEKTP